MLAFGRRSEPVHAANPFDSEGQSCSPSSACAGQQSRRTSRVATGRKQDLCVLIESLPELLVETVKKAVAEGFAIAAAAEILAEGNRQEAHRRRIDLGRHQVSPPRTPRRVACSPWAGHTTSNNRAAECHEKSDLEASVSPESSNSRPCGGRPPSPDSNALPHFHLATMKAVARAHEERILQGIGSPSNLTQLVPCSPKEEPIKRMVFLQRLRVNELTDDLAPNGLCPRDCASPFNFRLWGLLPWSETQRPPRFSFSWCYSWLTVLLCGLAFVTSTVAYCTWQRNLLLDSTRVLITFGALVAALQARILTEHDVIGFPLALLCRYAAARHFYLEWGAYAKFQCIATFLLQIAAVTAVFANSIVGGYDPRGIIQAISCAYGCGVILIVSSYIWYICCALQLAVDAFGSSFTDSPDFRRAVADWGELRAVTRKVSAAISPIFSTLIVVALVGTVIGFTAVSVLADGGTFTGTLAAEFVSGFGPVGLIALSVMATLLKAACVTEACKEVPEVINSWSFGVDLDEERSYIADYMHRSNTGFYLMGVRLTLSAVLKLSNTVALVGATLVAQVLGWISAS